MKFPSIEPHPVPLQDTRSSAKALCNKTDFLKSSNKTAPTRDLDLEADLSCMLEDWCMTYDNGEDID